MVYVYVCSSLITWRRKAILEPSSDPTCVFVTACIGQDFVPKFVSFSHDEHLQADAVSGIVSLMAVISNVSHIILFPDMSFNHEQHHQAAAVSGIVSFMSLS